MKTICLTAGSDLTDILWSATVLPHLKHNLSQTRLVWECPIREIKPWLSFYPELDEIVGDVEELEIPPDEYHILNPFWHPMDARVNTPLDAVFSLVKSFCSMPDNLPVRPYTPLLEFAKPNIDELPKRYLCLNPNIYNSSDLNKSFQNIWVTVISYLSIPTVQVGPINSPLLPGMIDGRGLNIIEVSQLINQSQLFIGGDSSLSTMATALQKPQVWLFMKDSNWWWPRGIEPECSLYLLNSQDEFNLEKMLSLAWQALEIGGDEAEI